MIARFLRKHVAVTLLLTALLIGGYTIGVLAQGEPSPIEVQLTAPQQAGPGQIIDVLVNYKVTDPNAGALLNYNLWGPGMVWQREPEPPNPIANTWGPQFHPLEGTIKIQVRINDDADGQVIRHEVEVKWGPKARKHNVETKIKFVPPTATPTARPRPRPSPTQPPPTPVKPSLNLSSVSFVSAGAEVAPLTETQANQEIALDVLYTSSGPVENATVRLWFEPDLVNVEGMQRTQAGYTVTLSSLAAAPEPVPLFEPPLKGRIRPYADGGEQYTLRAFVEISAPEGTIVNVPEMAETGPLSVSQESLVLVRASVDSEIVRTGGNVIVHAFCENPGQVTIRDIKLVLDDLPEGLGVQPGEQVVSYVLADGGSEERVFTIRAPEDEELKITFKVVATFDDTVVESEPLSVDITAPVPLTVEAASDDVLVRAGQSAYYRVSCANPGQFTAQNVTVRLIDTTGNLGVLLQDIGDLEPQQAQDLVFVVEIPPDFPADVTTSMIAQTISEDGSISEADPIPLTVVCVPSFELLVQPPAGKLEDGQTAEPVVLVRNVSQCTARDVSLEIGGLPEAFALPLAQNVVELAPG